ncbi:hypothetical protein B0T18DRAFT_485478 [Schizothecium vesticola]|uniref:Uncharacterized protein n=1 Tax=Schizothecium vesticola TaxID=314040 RepID=A0AA40K950_9PEZI|nr:hypothetical protein B0T18DRAFT_485478 [Schizothecium vesticola]
MYPDISVSIGPDTRYTLGKTRLTNHSIWVPPQYPDAVDIEAKANRPPPPPPLPIYCIAMSPNDSSPLNPYYKQDLQLVCRINGCELAFGESFKDAGALHLHLASPEHKKLNAETPPPAMEMAFEHIPTMEIHFLPPPSDENQYVRSSPGGRIRTTPNSRTIHLWTWKRRGGIAIVKTKGPGKR